MLASIWTSNQPEPITFDDGVDSGAATDDTLPPDDGFLPPLSNLPASGPGSRGGPSGGFSDRQRQGRRIENIARDPDADLELEIELREQAKDSGTLGEYLLAAPRRINQRRQQITNVGDAMQLCRDLVTRQVEKALDLRDKARPNEPITGDAFVRQAILTILPDAQQRRLFLDTASNPQTWPRLKTLFGAPPYHFLRPEDGGAIRAAGLSRGRAHMAYQTDDPLQTVTNITQFGAGQLIDQHERTYRVIPEPRRPLHEEDELPSRLDSGIPGNDRSANEVDQSI